MKKRILSILLTLVMVAGLVPGISLTVFADEEENQLKYIPQMTSIPSAGEGVTAGDEITYTITYTNHKISTADVTITDELDSNVEFVTADYGGTENNRVVSWMIKDVPAGQGGTVSLTVKVTADAPDTGAVKNMATVTIDGDALETNSVEIHVHSWSYALKNGTADTLVATCRNIADCPDTDGVSVTIIEPDYTDYTGSAIEASVSENSLGVDDEDITYTAAEGSELTDGMPVKVGTYTASITLGNATANVEYTIVPAPVITKIDFNRDSPSYDAETNTFYVSNDFPFYLIITGEYLTSPWPWYDGGKNALFFGSAANAGAAYAGVTVSSDTEAYKYLSIGDLNYITSVANVNQTGADYYITSVSVGLKTINVNIKEAPTYQLTILNSEHGTVSTGRTDDKIPEKAEVTLTVTPEDGYKLAELDVYTPSKDVEETEQSDGKYTFTMPASPTYVMATFEPLPHTHKWSYATEGSDTIKATCINSDENCTASAQTVTLYAPTLKEYGGTGSAEATISADTVGDIKNLSSLITYQKGTEILTSAPTSAGTYKAVLTVDTDKTAFVEYTISKRNITITANAGEINYGGSLIANDVYVSGSGFATGDVLYSVTLTPSTTNATTNGTITPSAAVIKNGNDIVTANYNISYVNGVLTIKKSQPAIAFKNYAPDRTYNGQALENPTAEQLELTGVQYSDLTFVWYKDSVAETNKLSAAPSDVGTYYVVAAVAETQNTEAASATSNAITINPIDISTAEVKLGDALTYNGSEQTQTVAEVKIGNLVVNADYYTVTNNKATNAGTVYELIVTAVENSNFTGSVKSSFSIAQKEVTRPVQASAVVYNGEEQTYGVASTTEYTVTNGVQKDADENGYEVTITLADKFNTVWDNGTTDNLTHKFIINKKAITVTADNKEANVGGKQPELTYTVDGLAGSDELITAPEITTDANMSRAGNYIITASNADAGSNYTISYVNGTLTVKSRSYIPSSTPTYDIKIADDIIGGNVSASKKLAYKGDTITITVAPEDGYELTALTVTDSRNNAITVTEENDTTHTFKMPGYDVKIDAEFAKTETPAPAIPTIDCPRDHTCPMYGYIDLDRYAWYHDGVHFCIGKDLMIGIATDTFAPDMTTSRAMIVTILWRMEGKPVANYAMSFEDVEADMWYTEAVRWAQANKIVLGYSDEAFGPNDVITREQLAAILYRYEQYKGGGFTNAWMIRMDYVDIEDVSDWAYEAMCWVNMKGIVNGKPDKVLDPKGSTTRAEAAAMIQRYCSVMTK